MPASIRSASSHASNRSTRSSTLERHRLSESRTRIQALGHLVGLDPAALPPLPPRADSPMSAMQDDLRTLYGAPSIDSIAAVVAQIAGPEPDAVSGESETGRRLGRKNSLSGLSERSGASGASSASGRSRSRARNAALAQQYARSHRSAHSVASVHTGSQPSIPRKPVPSNDLPRQTSVGYYPSVLRPGPGHRKTVSEVDLDIGTGNSSRNVTTRAGRNSTAAGKAGQVTTTAMPEWAKHVLRGTSFETPLPPIPPLGPISLTPVEDEDMLGTEEDYSRRGSTATVTLETYAAEIKTPRSRSRSTARGSSNTQQQVPTTRSRAGSSLQRSRRESAGDDARSGYSAYSAATISYMPRGVGASGFDEYRRHLPSSTVQSSQRQRRVADQEMPRQQSLQPNRDFQSRAQAAQLETSGIPPPPPPKESRQQQQQQRGQQRPPTLFIPPSQQPAKSFTVVSTKRIGTPPSPASAYGSTIPTTCRSSSSRSYGDVFSPLTTPSSCTPTSTHTSSSSVSRGRSRCSPQSCSCPSLCFSDTSRPRSRSRSASPARGSYNPEAVAEGRHGGGGVRARVEGALVEFKRRSQQRLRQDGPDGSSFKVLGDGPRRLPQEDIASWQCPTLKAPLTAAAPEPGAGRSFARRMAHGDAPSQPPPSSSSSSSSRRTVVESHRGQQGRPAGPPRPARTYTGGGARPPRPDGSELFVRGTTLKRESFLCPHPPPLAAPEPPKPRRYVPAHTMPVPNPDAMAGEGAKLRLQPTRERLKQFDFGFDRHDHTDIVGVSAEATNPKAAVPRVRVETPPSFVAASGLQRTDSLFITSSGVGGGNSRESTLSTPRRGSFFPPWLLNVHEAAAITLAAASELGVQSLGLAPERAQPVPPKPRDDRRNLPSQTQRTLRRRERVDFETVRHIP